jgi:hypothetical protein
VDAEAVAGEIAFLKANIFLRDVAPRLHTLPALTFLRPDLRARARRVLSGDAPAFASYRSADVTLARTAA